MNENLDGIHRGFHVDVSADGAIACSANGCRILSRDVSQDEMILSALIAELAAQGSY